MPGQTALKEIYVKNYLQHVHVFCRDLQPMIDFYEKVLGAKFECFRQFGGADGAVLDLNSPTKIYLKKIPDCLPQGATPSYAGSNHPGVLVEDLDATLNATRNMPGAAVTCEPFTSGTLRCAFITGPEGVIVEVMQETA